MFRRLTGLLCLSKISRRARFRTATAFAIWIVALGPTAASTESEPARPARKVAPSSEDATQAVTEETEVERKKSSRSSPPPPLGVRFGEPLEGQKFRVAYSFSRELRKGLLVGDRHRSPQNVLANSYNPYDRTPESLEVSVHTLQLAYAPHPRVTLVIEVPFVRKELETRDEFGAHSQVQTQGIGDIGFALVVPFILKGSESSHFHLGFNAPTGSIRRGGDNSRLPFDSQIGNGTFNLEWGWTYRGEMDWLSWGGQAVGWHPIGRNDLRYREGSRFETSIWSAIRLPAGFSASLRLAWNKRNNTRVPDGQFIVDPSDPEAIDDPSDNPKTRGGTRLSVSPGLALDLPQLGNQRIAIEIGIPVHQDLDGPQLKQDWTLKAGWQWKF